MRVHPHRASKTLTRAIPLLGKPGNRRHGLRGPVTAALILAVMVVIGGVGPAAAASNPSIGSFLPNHTAIAAAGGSDTLNWTLSNATGCTMSSSPDLLHGTQPVGCSDSGSNQLGIGDFPANTGTTPVTYTFTLTANGASGTTPTTAQTTVTVEPPVAPQPAIGPVCVTGHDVALNGSVDWEGSTPGQITIAWGDGTSTTATAPFPASHGYSGSTTGSEKITVTATSAAGTGMMTAPITVGPSVQTCILTEQPSLPAAQGVYHLAPTGSLGPGQPATLTLTVTNQSGTPLNGVPLWISLAADSVGRASACCYSAGAPTTLGSGQSVLISGVDGTSGSVTVTYTAPATLPTSGAAEISVAGAQPFGSVASGTTEFAYSVSSTVSALPSIKAIPNPCPSGELAAYIKSGHDCLTSSAWQAAPAGSPDPCPALGTWNATTTTWSCHPSTSGGAPEYDATYLQCLSAGLGFVSLCDNAGWATSLVSGFLPGVSFITKAAAALQLIENRSASKATLCAAWTLTEPAEPLNLLQIVVDAACA